ncbi:F0F1 ATP synthase subunit B family protein [Lyticum sinuosum]|uniref:ATP synthase subunit b domain protein n=1 Tax=Lyticum sinuosum TaxID=1332059 RepID=A0AAE5AH15_9RICK|nr:hypothetical protein [Lyticum sinuosum]MDZ5761462.1 ATP synthase subunit b domain protein [Lyticum sinuosum]
MTNVFLNEGLWMFLALISLIFISYKPVKNKIKMYLNTKIIDLEKEIASAIMIKETASLKLHEIQEKHRKAVDESQRIQQEAKNRADEIMLETNKKIQSISNHSKVMINLYKEKSDNDIVNILKNDVVLTVINMLENNHMKYSQNDMNIDSQDNNDNTSKNISDSEQNNNINQENLEILKKIWN